jgi:hypothetical protein
VDHGKKPILPWKPDQPTAKGNHSNREPPPHFIL